MSIGFDIWSSAPWTVTQPAKWYKVDMPCMCLCVSLCVGVWCVCLPRSFFSIYLYAFGAANCMAVMTPAVWYGKEASYTPSIKIEQFAKLDFIYYYDLDKNPFRLKKFRQFKIKFSELLYIRHIFHVSICWETLNCSNRQNQKLHKQSMCMHSFICLHAWLVQPPPDTTKLSMLADGVSGSSLPPALCTTFTASPCNFSSEDSALKVSTPALLPILPVIASQVRRELGKFCKGIGCWPGWNQPRGSEDVCQPLSGARQCLFSFFQSLKKVPPLWKTFYADLVPKTPASVRTSDQLLSLLMKTTFCCL